MRYIALMVFSVLLLAGCSEPSLQDRVPAVAGEIVYEDVFLGGLKADEIRFFGVALGDSLEDIHGLHGEPDEYNQYRFGRVENLEYRFGLNSTAVLYHAEQGVVTSVLVEGVADGLVAPSLNMSLTDVYSVFGIPVLQLDRSNERVFLYDSLGFEIFLRRGLVDRIYFTQPDRGIEGVGTPVNRTLNASGNRPPAVCIQVVTPARSPDGSCQVFPSPCDVPDGWDVVDSCP